MPDKINPKQKRTVIYSLKAPRKLAQRHSGNNKGQRYRTIFMRDRDRILYSRSFRRLAGKTQVYSFDNDDYKRTRLTHTLEVAQIAKTIASNLKLDIDLTEAIALGHDIGHTPFGHAGERILHEIMTPSSSGSLVSNSPFNSESQHDDYYGFKHNLQSLAVSIEGEQDYDQEGLDLSNFTLYGMNIHSSPFYKNDKDGNKLGYYDRYKSYMFLPESTSDAWSFEAFVVKEADEIAQRHHDIEDAIRGNLISKEEVIKQINNHFKEYLDPSKRKILNTMKQTNEAETFISQLSKVIVNLFVTQIINSSIHNINQFITDNEINVFTFPQYLSSHSAKDVNNIIAYNYIEDEQIFIKKMKDFEKFISIKVHSSYDIQSSDARGQYIIKKLFQAYFKNPIQLPDHCIVEYYIKNNKHSISEIQKIIKEKGMGEIRAEFSTDKKNDILNNPLLMRIICNQISGMTDSFAYNTYMNLYL